MRIPRRDRELNDHIEVLDATFADAQSKSKTQIEAIPRAWDMLCPDELAFIDGEIERCVLDRRYFLENYYVIRDESGRLHTLYPWWDQQEIIYAAVEEEWRGKGVIRIIILKPRQCGSTTWDAALIFHATVFVPNAFSLMMADKKEVSDEIYQRVNDAQLYLPWWLWPSTLSRRQGMKIIYQRPDEQERILDPGLGSTVLISNAQQGSVAIGRTCRNILASEMSRWPDATLWTADIRPSLNAPDMTGIIESTAFGRAGLYHSMWKASEAGKSIWRALFIPVYKVRKYFIPVLKSEQFTLTPDETKIRRAVREREDFTIPLGFFKWRRQEVQETLNAGKTEEDHAESYPLNPKEAFISSGFCAFPRKELTRQERIHCRDPKLIGEIEYVGPDQPPVLHLHPPAKDEIADKPERSNRFWVWEEPEEGQEYYLAADVGGSGEGNDFSDGVVYRLGWGDLPDVQVAEWHGHINASHFAKVLAAIGHWYFACEIAVEYAKDGVTTGNELQWNLDYPNIYRWKHLDKISGSLTLHTHWMTTARTRDDMINRMCERLLDHQIEIRNRHTIEEMRDFGREESGDKAQGLENNDDAVIAHCICIAASIQSGKRRSMTEERGLAGSGSATSAMVLPRAPMVYNIMDHYGRQVQQVNSIEEGNKVIEACERKYRLNLKGLWKVVPVVVMAANTPVTPAYNDPQSPEGQLYRQYGIEPRHQSPSIVGLYRQMLAEQRAAGAGGDRSAGMEDGGSGEAVIGPGGDGGDEVEYTGGGYDDD